MKKIVILLAMVLFAGMQVMWAQNPITGKVTDSDGATLPGATVRAVGFSGVGTVTDMDGNYSLEVPQGATNLIFSFVGMKEKTVAINGQSTINVVLEAGDIGLEEVVIVAYGSAKKGSITGSMEVVKAEKLDRIPSASFEKMLQGNVSGLQVTTASGQPGSGAEVRIRGISSISAGNEPLYIIDGMPIITGALARTDQNTDGTGSDVLSNTLSNLNPDDIATISVLKDASATALYGSRAANGVILITTKSGQAGKTKINFASQFGMSARTTNNFNVLNATEYMELVQEGAINAGMTPEAALLYSGTDAVNTNWLDEAFRSDAPTQSYKLSASGGTDKTRFFVSGEYFDQEGIALGSYLERMSSRINIEHDINKSMKFGLRFAPSYSNSGMPLTSSAYFISPVTGSYLMRPNVPARNEDGTAYFDQGGPTGGASFLGVDDYNDQGITTLRLLGSTYFQYEIIPGLIFKTQIGQDLADVQEQEWDDPRNPGNTAEGKGRATRRNTRQLIWTNTNTLNWTKTFNQDHNVGVLLGHEAQSSLYTAMDVSAEDFPGTELRELSAGATPVTSWSSATDYKYLSVFGQTEYNYKGRYYFKANFRRDGSSKFGSNNKWANFWSTGLTWRISEEAFMESLTFIDNMKLRASHGTVGNSDVSNYAWQGLYGYGSDYLGNPGSAPSQIENPDLTWETSATSNVGLDIEFLKRFNVTAELYHIETTNLLLYVPISSTSGFTSALKNVGSMRNQGVEWSLGAKILTGEFKWNVDVNMTINENEILELNNDEDIIDGTKIRRVGEPYQTFYLQEWAGVNPANGNALWYDEDGNITDNYSEASREIVGTADPKFYGGFTNSLSFKGFSLDFFFFYNYGNEIYNNTSRITSSDGAFANFNQSTDQLDRWQNPGDISENPQRINGNPTSSNQQSTRWLEDGSYLRLKNLTFAYSVPKDILAKVKISSAKIYFQGLNLYTFTNFKGLDPEQALNGTHWFIYPNAKTYTIGINLGF